MGDAGITPVVILGDRYYMTYKELLHVDCVIHDGDGGHPGANVMGHQEARWAGRGYCTCHIARRVPFHTVMYGLTSLADT